MKGIVSMLLAFLVSSIVFSQDDLKKIVVLYNTEPLKVSVNAGGEIFDIYGKAEGYLTGYEVVKNDHALRPEDQATDFSKIEGYYVVSTENEVLTFKEGLATLSKPIIESLDNLISQIIVDPRKKILLTPYAVDDKNTAEVYLLQNRMNSCLAYLALRGLSKNQIVISEEPNKSTKKELIATTLQL